MPGRDPWPVQQVLGPHRACTHLVICSGSVTIVLSDVLGLRPQLEGQGIASLSAFLETFGYRDAGDELDFPKKKLRARWMRMWPPRDDLPRVFISELKAWPVRVTRGAGPVLCLHICAESSLRVLRASLVAAAEGMRRQSCTARIPGVGSLP